jgi:hypothetical protein
MHSEFCWGNIFENCHLEEQATGKELVTIRLGLGERDCGNGLHGTGTEWSYCY